MLAQQAGHGGHSPFARGDRPPRPARLGQRRLRVGDLDPADPILPERQGEPRELPLEPGPAGGLWREQRELLTGRRGRAVQLEHEPGDRGRWRGALEPGEQQALDRLGVGGRFGEALLDVELGRRPGQGEGEIEVQVQPGPRGRQPARDELVGQGDGQPVEDEAERLEILDGGLDGQAEARRSGARRGRNGSSSSPRARAWIRAPSSPNRATSADRSSSATAPIRRRPKRREPGPDIGILGEEARRMRGEEPGLAAGRDEVGCTGPGQDGGHGRR